MIEHSVLGDTLSIGGETVRFGAPIAQHVEYDDFLVVRLKTTGKDHPDKYRNVVAVDGDGTIRWKIPEQPPSEPRPYTNVSKDGEDLWVNNFSGHLHRVDPDTGDLLDREFVK